MGLTTVQRDCAACDDRSREYKVTEGRILACSIWMSCRLQHCSTTVLHRDVSNVDSANAVTHIVSIQQKSSWTEELNNNSLSLSSIHYCNVLKVHLSSWPVEKHRELFQIITDFFNTAARSDGRLSHNNWFGYVHCWVAERGGARCFTEHNILTKLENLKLTKCPGPDTLHPRLLYEIRYEIVQPLKMLFESHIKSILPSD